MSARVLGGRYELGERLGEGGMAVVYRGLDRALERRIAIKMLRPSLAADRALVERFQHEARSAARLSHPSLVDIYDVGQDGDDHYIVMELVEGGDLAEQLEREGSLPPARVARLGAQVARALDYAHKRGLVHRDVKPHNVLLDPDGQSKLADFGIARALGAPVTTATGVVLGTVHYMAPEQARGQGVGPAADLYSLGTVLYEAATGRPPFEGDNPLALALAHATQAPVPPRQLNPSVPPALERVILRALAKEPEQRFASATEMAAALEAAAIGDDRRTAAVAAVGATGAAGAAARRVAAPTRVVAGPAAGTVPVVAPRDHRSPAARPRRASRLGPLVLGLMLLASLGFLALGALWLFGAPPRANDGRPPGSPTLAPQPTGTGPVIVSPAASRTPTPRPPAPSPTPSAAPTVTPTPAATATRAPSATPTLARPTVPPVTMPNLVGQPVNDAVAQLRVRQIRPDLKDAADPRRPDGVVLGQDPPPGTALRQGSTARLTINRLAQVTVPNVQGLEEHEAKRVLERAGFEVEVDRDTGGRKGVVYDQSPQPNQRVPAGSTVRISVGR